MYGFYKLPAKIVDQIFDNLNFSEIVKLRLVNKWFNTECSRILNTAFMSLKSAVDCLIPAIRNEAKSFNTNGLGSDREIQQISCACTFYKTYLILKSELNVLYAVCGRYIQLGLYCFTGGKIIDYFKQAINLPFHFNCEKNRPLQTRASITIRLFLLDEEFLDHFEDVIEPLILERYGIALCCGTKIVDMLDSYICSNYHLETTYNGNTCQICGRYEILDTHSISPPLKVQNNVATASDLKNIMRYLRNEVRWNNYLYALDCAFATCVSNIRLDRKRRKFCLNSNDEMEVFNKYAGSNELGKTPEVAFDKMFSRRIGNPSEKENVSYFIELECSKYCAPMRLSPYILEATQEHDRWREVTESSNFSEIMRHIAANYEFNVALKVILFTPKETNWNTSTENSLNLYTDGDLYIVFQNTRDIPW